MLLEGYDPFSIMDGPVSDGIIDLIRAGDFPKRQQEEVSEAQLFSSALPVLAAWVLLRPGISG